MSDDITELRAALAAATPGPWEVLDGTRVGVTLPSPVDGCGCDSHCVALTHGEPRLTPQANAAYIAACSPDRIARLLDRLEAADDGMGEGRHRRNCSADHDSALQLRRLAPITGGPHGSRSQAG